MPQPNRAIRFNIFQLRQTYTGEDERLQTSAPKALRAKSMAEVDLLGYRSILRALLPVDCRSKGNPQPALYRYKQLGKH